MNCFSLSTNLPVTARSFKTDNPRPVPHLNKLNMHFNVQDLSVPSNDLPITFERIYNSSYVEGRDGPLGIGWTHSYNLSIRLQKGEMADHAVFTDSAGQRYAFERRFDGTYITPPMIKAVLTEDEDTGAYTLAYRDKTEYAFTREGGVVVFLGYGIYKFIDGVGYLVGYYIIDGWRLDAEYSYEILPSGVPETATYWLVIFGLILIFCFKKKNFFMNLSKSYN